MKPRLVALGCLMVAGALHSGCSFPLKGYTWKQWNSLPAAERRRLVDERYPPNPGMHAALAQDAAALRENSR